MTPIPSPPLRAVAFFDGQNLFHAAKLAFGFRFPNFDPQKLAQAVCVDKGWALAETRFYTGVPEVGDNAFWNHFWTHKLAQMGRQGIHVFSRPLRYQNKAVRLSDGSEHTFLVGQEKGIDIRIALDVVGLAHARAYDVALIFSQDQDLSEAADEIRAISREQGRFIKLASAFPVSPAYRNKRGINKTDWISLDRATYNSCIDSRDYRPKPGTS